MSLTRVSTEIGDDDDDDDDSHEMSQPVSRSSMTPFLVVLRPQAGPNAGDRKCARTSFWTICGQVAMTECSVVGVGRTQVETNFLAKDFFAVMSISVVISLSFEYMVIARHNLTGGR